MNTAALQQDELFQTFRSPMRVRRDQRYSQRGDRPDLEQYFTPFWAASRLVEEFFPDQLLWALEASGQMENTIILRSEEHTSELQSLMRISYAVFCSKKK